MSNPNVVSQVVEQINESVSVKNALASQCAEPIVQCADILIEAAKNNHLIMLCGNGGSAADSQHIAAELVVRLRSNVERRAIAAMALTVDTSILTAGGNDYGFERIFSRQVEAFGKPGDVLIAITTSGTSKNIVSAVEQAKLQGVKTIGLLGGTGGVLKDMCNASVVVPSNITARIQECHILIGHMWCQLVEEAVRQ